MSNQAETKQTADERLILCALRRNERANPHERLSPEQLVKQVAREATQHLQEHRYHEIRIESVLTDSLPVWRQTVAESKLGQPDDPVPASEHVIRPMVRMLVRSPIARMMSADQLMATLAVAARLGWDTLYVDDLPPGMLARMEGFTLWIANDEVHNATDDEPGA